jgi:hypothetical protein
MLSMPHEPTAFAGGDIYFPCFANDGDIQVINLIQRIHKASPSSGLVAAGDLYKRIIPKSWFCHEAYKSSVKQGRNAQ